MYRLVSLAKYPYALPQPKKDYTSTFVWSGPLVLDTHEKKCWSYRPREGGCLERVAHPYPHHLSTVHNQESVRVKIYNKNMWSENDDLFITSA